MQHASLFGFNRKVLTRIVIMGKVLKRIILMGIVLTFKKWLLVALTACYRRWAYRI